MDKSNMDDVIEKLKAFPTPLSTAFAESRPMIETIEDAELILHWAQEGVRIAQLSSRSWEVAVEYFRATPTIVPMLGQVQLQRWIDCGVELNNDSPVMAGAFFRASPTVLPRISPRQMALWANLGKSMSQGTWKSSTLATRFFDSSPELSEQLSFREIDLLASLVKSLSNRSHDLAVECLNLGLRVLPSINEKEELISLASILVESSWREVRGCFEAANRVSVGIKPRVRKRYYSLTQQLARQNMVNVSMFMLDTSLALSPLSDDEQSTVLTKAESLVAHSVEAVDAFLRNITRVLDRISPSQLDHWYENGTSLLDENLDSGVAYFRIESSRAEAMLDNLSSSVELDKVKGTLTMYGNALAGSEITLDAANESTHKNVGWVEVERATTDGNRIYLPTTVNLHSSKSDNFSWLKVVTTHQIGHMEYSSFEFQFEGESNHFENTRIQIEQSQEVSQSPTEMARYFNLFPNRTLAADIFSVVEDARIDFNLTNRYRGLAPSYWAVQDNALTQRGPIKDLPIQEAMVELLIRLSLHQVKNLPVPKDHTEEARSIAGILKSVQSLEATVQDTAEATIRIYYIVSQLPNETAPPEQWEEQDMEDADFSNLDLDQLVQQFLQDKEGSNDDDDYESPEDVDYRGDFKPEMVQLLSRMRDEQSGSESEQQESISQESLEEMLRESEEFEIDDDASVTTIAGNLIKEISSEALKNSPASSYNEFTHQDEAEGSLKPDQPTSYVYDEWDFRANDYRPNWCVVQEKQVVAGETTFFSDTLQANAGLMDQIKRQFESIKPETYRKLKRLPEGEDIDLDGAIDALIDIRSGHTPDDRIYWRRNKTERDVAVVFLLDMSASTAEAVEETKGDQDWNAPTDPIAYGAWLHSRRGETKRQYKRIIDVEKESMVLLMTALETIGDRYGVYGFSGFGRENVEFYVIKEIDEPFADRVKRRLDKVAPLHATRMGPAIRHASMKLANVDSKTKFLFVVSDGRPQDRGYSREGVEKEYAVQDTRMALLEARQKDITPFCLTVDRQGHDYLQTMAGDMGYEVVPDIKELPKRLPHLYRRLTV